MAIDSNSPGDDRGPGAPADRLAAAGLKLVTEGERPSGSAGASAGRPLVSSQRQLPLWLFVTLFVLFLLGYGYQIHHASRLELEVTRLEKALAESESRLESHRLHLREIRGGVHDLSARLEQLRILIDRDPTGSAAKRRDQGAPILPDAAPR